MNNIAVVNHFILLHLFEWYDGTEAFAAAAKLDET
jgi:hypothetical protein